MPLTGGAKDTSYATWALTSQTVWPGQGWHHHYMNSQTKIKFDDSPRIGTWGCVDSNQKVKASMRVPAPLVLGHRNVAGDVRRRPMRRRYRMSQRRWNAWEWSGAHHGAVELIGEAGDGQEEEIDNGRASGCRALRGWLGASWIAWLGGGGWGSHGEALGLHGATPVGFNRRRRGMARLGFWSPARNLEEGEELGFLVLSTAAVHHL
jgi:hypothetical protein